MSSCRAECWTNIRMAEYSCMKNNREKRNRLFCLICSGLSSTVRLLASCAVGVEFSLIYAQLNVAVSFSGGPLVAFPAAKQLFFVFFFFSAGCICELKLHRKRSFNGFMGHFLSDEPISSENLRKFSSTCELSFHQTLWCLSVAGMEMRLCAEEFSCLEERENVQGECEGEVLRRDGCVMFSRDGCEKMDRGRRYLLGCSKLRCTKGSGNEVIVIKRRL